MARYAIVRQSDAEITNVIELENPGNYNPGTGFYLVADPNGAAQIGGHWTGTEFEPAPPPPPPPPTPPTVEELDERIDTLEAWTGDEEAREATEATHEAGQDSAISALQSQVGALDDLALSTPSRALNTTFMPHATKNVLVSYSVRITCTASIGSNAEGSVELRSDASDPGDPAIVRARAQNRNAFTLAVTLQGVNEQTVQLSHLVPAGHKVRLVTASTGTVAFAIVAQTETVIG